MQQLIDFNRMKPESARPVGTRVHTQPTAAGKVLAMLKPRMAVAYHFINGIGSGDEVRNEIRTTYDGPLSLAQDMMTWNVTKEYITVRMAVGQPLTWPSESKLHGAKIEPEKRTPISQWLDEGRLDLQDIDGGIFERLDPTTQQQIALRAMALVNLAAGAALALVGRRGEDALAQSEGPAAPVRGLAAFAAVALLSGFAMMTLQTVLIRLGGHAFGASQFTFSLVVSVFVLCIAVGSFAVSALRRIPDGMLVANLWLLFALLVLLYGVLEDASYWAHRLRTLLPPHDEAAFAAFQLATFACVLAAIGLPVAVSGATLPLIFHRLRREQGELGRAAGRLYGWNTAVSLAGALLGGYALLQWLDLHAVYRVALVARAPPGGHIQPISRSSGDSVHPRDRVSDRLCV